MSTCILGRLLFLLTRKRFNMFREVESIKTDGIFNYVMAVHILVPITFTIRYQRFRAVILRLIRFFRAIININ